MDKTVETIRDADGFMTQQVITYADGGQTVIDYHRNGAEKEIEAEVKANTDEAEGMFEEDVPFDEPVEVDEVAEESLAEVVAPVVEEPIVEVVE